MDLKTMLQDKIDLLHNKERTIKKIFKFDPAESRKNPTVFYDTILEYLERHKEKILDFDLNYWIDEKDCSVMISVDIVPTEDISRILIPIYPLFGSTSREAILHTMREHIQNILSYHKWDLETEKSRKKISEELSIVLDTKIEYKKINKEADNSPIYFKAISENGEEKELESYINKISKNGKNRIVRSNNKKS